MSDTARALSVRYGHLVPAMRDHHPNVPVLVEPLGGPLAGLVDLESSPATIDADLLAAGSAHVDMVRRTRRVTDGETLVLDRMEFGRLTARRAGYLAMLATCDALRAESERGNGSPLRDRVDSLAEGDPLHRGTGRAASIGVSVVTTIPRGSGSCAVLGRRRPDLATDPGRWHVVPSGMLDATGDTNPVLDTVQRELSEELSLEIPVQVLEARVQVLGIAHDLLRLRPEICLQLDLPENSPVQVSTDEFDACRLVPLRIEATSNEWPMHDMTPAGAGALALAFIRLAEVQDDTKDVSR